MIHARHAHIIHAQQWAWIQGRDDGLQAGPAGQGAAGVAGAVHRLGEQRVGTFGRLDDHVEGFCHCDAQFIDRYWLDVQAIAGDYGHFQARDTHVEIRHGRAVDQAQSNPLARLEQPGPVHVRGLAVHQVGVGRAADIRQVSRLHPHFRPHPAITSGLAPAFLTDVVDEVADSTLVIVVIVGLFLERFHQLKRLFVGPVAEHDHVFAVVFEWLWLFGVDHQRPVNPRLFLKARVAVVPIGAVLFDLEAIDVHAIGRDTVEAQPRHAVHVGGQNDAVPVDRGGFVETVFYPDGHRIAFAPAQQRAWNTAVDRHRGSGITRDIDLGFADIQIELGAGQPGRLTRVRNRPCRTAPQPQAAEDATGGKPFHKGSS